MTRAKVPLLMLAAALSASVPIKGLAGSYATPVPQHLAPAVRQFAPPAAVTGQCGEDMTLTQATPLQFGLISVAHDAGGVVIVSPGGTAASLGEVAAGPGVAAATVQICGVANEEFLMHIEPGNIGLVASGITARPYMVHDLEATATGAQLRPTGDGQWQGVLGPRGMSQIRIGGSLTIPAHQSNGTYSARLRIRVDKLR